MTRALVWKELREQRAVWLVLALAAAGGMAGARWAMVPGMNRDQMLVGILWFTVWGYGLVCGALPLAGETEEGTQDFLDTLPETRRRLYRVKVLTGLALLAAQMAALALVGYSLLWQRNARDEITLDALVALYFGVSGFAWGLFCGSFTDKVLRAVTRAFFLQVGTALLLFVALGLAVESVLPESLQRTLTRDRVLLAFTLLTGSVAAGAALGSRRIYCRTDGTRTAAPSLRRAVRGGWGELLWLAWRQSRRLAVGLAVYEVVAGLMIALLGLTAWPALSLLAGVACGVTAFGDEQRSGGSRFLGDQRFPLGRLWLVKSGLRLALGLAFVAVAGFAMFAALFVRVAIDPARQSLVVQAQLQNGALAGLMAQPYQSLTVWLVYGFAAGLPMGLLFRRPLAAGAAALGLAAPLAALWLPSQVGGGLHIWEVWGVPAVLVAATPLLLRPWSAGRILSARAAGVAMAAALAIAVWYVEVLDYRVAEIPPAPDTVDVAAFRASLPTPEQNVAGRLTASALRRLAEIERTFVDDEADRPLPPLPDAGRRPAARPAPEDAFRARVSAVAAHEWSRGDRHLKDWLDRVLADGWAEQLAEAAGHPTGVALDPREATLFDSPREVEAARTAAALLVAHGLERQAHGEPAVFVDDLRTGLALVRNLRHQTLKRSVDAGRAAETVVLEGVGQWLGHLKDRPTLLRRALALLAGHERERQTDPEEVRRAALLAAHNTFADPGNLLISNGTSDFFFPSPAVQTGLLRLAWQAPWEEARLRRLLDELASRAPGREELAASSPHVRSVRPAFVAEAYSPDASATAWPLSRERAALLQVALRLYQAEKGRPARQLADLVPKYLAAVPADPFDGRPFRYHLSRGEVLLWQWPPGVREVPADQGILWCVGDGRDDGGHMRWITRALGAGAHDVVFLVPPPPDRR
jgi:hypothetical protein